MPDREKVIKELEWQINVFTSYCASDERLLETMKASLALLKEQEAVEPKVIRMNAFGHPVHACGKCGLLITESMNYCSRCGKSVKWDA